MKSASVPFTVGGYSGIDNKGGNNTQEPDNTVVIYPTKDDFDWSLVNFETGIHSFTGTYETNYDTLSMVQNGSNVTGQYPGWDNGRLDGTVIDGVLYGYWYESPSYAPPSDAGQLIFVMNADGKEFTGWWRYGNSGSWDIWSTGVRNELDTSGWAGEEVAKADALGLIPETLKGADLSQPIEIITGYNFKTNCLEAGAIGRRENAVRFSYSPIYPYPAPALGADAAPLHFGGGNS